MRIGIDFHLAEREGTGNSTYIRNLVESLLSLDSQNEYFLYITGSKRLTHKSLVRAPNVRLRPLAAGTAPLRLLLLGLKTFADRLDILHVQYVAPPFFRGNLVVTVHDIAFVRFPGLFAPGQRLYLKHLVPLSLRKARQILTISSFARGEILARYRLQPRSVHATPLAAAASLQPGHSPSRSAAAQKLKSLGIKRPFLLFVGRVDVRKNIPCLIQAFTRLQKAKGLPHRLVIAGPRSYMPASQQAEIARGVSDERVLLTGFLPEEMLPALYSCAEAFVYPSLYEGFGLPLVEAMACGCPVISTKTSAIPEVVGRAGLLVKPDDPAALAEAIWKVVSDRDLRMKMRRLGLGQAAKFRWEDTARRTLAAYGRASQARATP